jgi:hypothetical protein
MDYGERRNDLDSVDTSHLNHCFDYLRQGIMCSGDMTLEKAWVVDGEVTNAVTGWGVEHECRDWKGMHDFAVKHRVGSAMGIISPGG